MKRMYRFLNVDDGQVLLMRLLARFHCALPVAVGCAAVFELLGLEARASFLRGLLFCVPVAFSYYAAERLPALWQFFLASLLISGLSWLMLGHVGGAVLSAFVCFFRGRARLQEEKTSSGFDEPYYPVLALLLAFFLMSAFLGLPALQRISLFSAVWYFLICLLYRGVKRLEEYLVLNRNIHNLPVRRIQFIAGSAVAVAAFLAAILLLPAALGASGGIRIEPPQRPNRVVSEFFSERTSQAGQGGYDFLSELEAGSSFQIPPFVSYLLYALAAICLAALFFYGIYKIFQNFRASYTDTRDVVQFLAAEDRAESLPKQKRIRKRAPLWDRSPDAVIRRRYRKTVLRAVHMAPQCWRTPAEIESWAGLAEPRLHALYEKARYSLEPCTQEEARELKEKAFKV